MSFEIFIATSNFMPEQLKSLNLKALLAAQFQLNEEGIWEKTHSKDLSYPAEGHQFCFQVEDNSFWFQHRNRCILAAVKKYGCADIFFDLGGGNGCTTKQLEDAGIPAVLVEPAMSGCVNARKRGVSQVICSDLESLDFTTKISSIGLFDVLEHIQDENSFLQRVRDNLTDGGKLYLTVPAFSWLWSHEDIAAGHHRRYSLQQLQSVLRKNRFKLIYQTYFFEFLVLPVLFLRRLPYLLGKRHPGYSEEQMNQEHACGSESPLLRKILSNELFRLLSGKVRFGTSALVVAEKEACV